MLNDNREWDEAIIRIEHAETDDELEISSDALPMTLAEAIAMAKARTLETWDEYAEEDAGTNGFPVYGITIELNDLSGGNAGLVCSVTPQNMWFEGDELMGEWIVDGGMLEYKITA